MNDMVKVILSWPTVCIVALLVLRKPIVALIHRLIHSDSGGEAEIGPIRIKLGKMTEEGKKALGTVNRISTVLGASRRLELEIFKRSGAQFMTEAEAVEMRHHIGELARLTKEAEQSLAAYGDTAAAEG